MRWMIFPILVIAATVCAEETPWPQYETNPFVINLDIPAPEDSAGGITSADFDNDGLMDFLVTVPGYVAAYGHRGGKLWIHQVAVCVGGSSENVGLPGHNAPGVVAADIDGDGKTEVLYLTREGVLRVVDGATGAEKWTASPPAPEGAERWEHLLIANFRGEGLRDILLQATNATGYRMGHMLAAYRLEDLAAGRLEALWQTSDFLACAHNGARIADLNGDSKHEILGGDIFGPDGVRLLRPPIKGHIDSVFAADVRPDLHGLEVVMLEEGGGNRVFLCARDSLIWETHYQHWEPQNAALGEFDLERPGLEIWCRSRFNTHQKPFVFDAQGELIVQYELASTAPQGWTDSGVEIIYAIHWTGEPRQLACATERHTKGDLCVFDPMNGQFIERFKDEADRLFVADVSGDWREEIVSLNKNELRIYHNPAPNPNPDQPRLWKDDHYRAAKMTYNYYSP